jgi:outer membrane protein assembly factor BamE (lipoprotein component of BamABCDE complex)
MNSKFKIVKNMVIMFSCLIIGCVVGVREHGRKFDVSAVNKIEVGKTTEAEVIALLGEPKDKTILKGGGKVYGYFYGERKTKDYFFVEKKEWTGAALTIVFDEKGIVSSVSSSNLPQ